jgi:alkylation response protein AidB-like acyl-CoA dehydrogenase
MPTETQSMLSHSISAMLERHEPIGRLCEGRDAANLWDAVVELGLAGAEIPEELGGLGLPFSDIAPMFEDLGRGLAATCYLEFAVIGIWLLHASGNAAAHDPLTGATSGDIRAVLAFSEYGSAGDPAFTRTNATAIAEGWALRGAKSVVVGGQIATHLLVPALRDGELALFLVPVDAPGVTRNTLQLYDGSSAADITLDNVQVPLSHVLASGAQAADLIAMALDRGRAALCHEAVGLMAAVHGLTLDYVKARKQFGQPIGAFQTMQHRLANMFMDLELSRSAADVATSAVQRSVSPQRRMQDVSAAMVTLCQCARNFGQNAVQAHGGIALTREYQAGHYFKRLTMIERYLGTGEDHLERFIALAGC